MRGSRNVELARLKKKEERRKKNILTIWPLSGSVLSQCFTAPLGMLLAIRTLEDGWYVVINAYKLTVLEIWRDFNVLSYIAGPCYPYIRVYRLYDNPWSGPVVARKVSWAVCDATIAVDKLANSHCHVRQTSLSEACCAAVCRPSVFNGVSLCPL